MPQERQRLLKFATHLSACTPEATTYGRCVSEKAEKITHNACQKEFQTLLHCFKKQNRSIPNTEQTKMKAKRYKQANKILTHFRYNHGYEPPLRVLVDGTFCKAALESKINLREQIPKYLGCEVDIYTTSCIVQELEALGKKLFGALNICKQFEKAHCPHKPAKTASECQVHLARRSKRADLPKYIIATQQQSVLEKLRELGHVPALFIKFNAILFDKKGQLNDGSEEKNAKEMSRLQEIKKSVFGTEEKRPLKRKGPKGPNPLSCKRKKIEKSAAVPVKSQAGGEADGAPTEKKKRRRKKKPTTGGANTSDAKPIESKE
uniref:rRNA-processing protein UTP23 homolog n=1 Tax=Steinernema glaseri TaxID=37863 RepID=A0A1I8A7A1_9BILA